jgi:hypothetical protein
MVYTWSILNEGCTEAGAEARAKLSTVSGDKYEEKNSVGRNFPWIWQASWVAYFLGIFATDC